MSVPARERPATTFGRASPTMVRVRNGSHTGRTASVCGWRVQLVADGQSGVPFVGERQQPEVSAAGLAVLGLVCDYTRQLVPAARDI